ncbi:DUF6527 family protein [Thalassospiraceae bacterium LMO-JJ14]|nr:DUF6527 family protein [Thalassospiraceae bacterium LMO-JJ14]
MKRPIAFNHEFVEFIPEKLAERTIYVSINYATATHKCACGCGAEVVTPISPTDWKLMFDGRSVSLHPSIGNWSLKCRSHYWIKNDRISWAEDWSPERVAAFRGQKKTIRITSSSSKRKLNPLEMLWKLVTDAICK